MKEFQSALLATALLFLCLYPVANGFSLPGSVGGALTELKNLATSTHQGAGNTSNTGPNTSTQTSNQSTSSSATKPAGVPRFTLIKTANPVIPSYPGLSVDILGIKPGMSVKAVEAALRAAYPKLNPQGQPNPSIDWATTSVPSGGPVPLQSQRYVGDMSASKPNDHIQIYFGTPTTGNTVVSVTRQIQFPTKRSEPTLKQILSALDKKYGRETVPSRDRSSEGELVNWDYGKAGHLKRCPAGINNGAGECMCRVQFDPWTPATTEPFIKQDFDFCIVTAISLGYNKYHVKSVGFILGGPVDMAIDAKSFHKQVKAAQVAASKHEVTAKVPNF